MPEQLTPPRAPASALEAAQLLVDQGEHVHYVAESQSLCLSAHCPPDPV
ncbi:hypothetical protein [Streptomyces sp. NBC_00670]|nr:hypothetical protein [Streptomyces sp. NBC_00670]